MNLFNYETFAEFSKKLKSSNLELIEFIIMREIKMFGVSKKQIYSRLSEYIDIMKQSILNGLKTNKELICLTNDAIRLQKNKKKFLATLEYKILTSAISVAFYNCSMGKIVACPTAGSCGILPGALIPISEKYKLSKNKLINALILAGEIGRIMANQTSISGAVGGCMAECGVASAMTASAIVYCFNGNLESILTAAALSLKNNLGLICDPVAGLVEVPCVKRNGFKAIEALTSAQLALAGIKTAIPLDEILLAMKEISEEMPEKFKETSDGGLAQTPTGLKFKRKLQKIKLLTKSQK